MTDIVERLRGNVLTEPWDETATAGLMGEAADEIELLRKSVVIVQHELAATIERCAQEIEGRYFKHINDAAAAIRALKDKAGADPNLVYPGKDDTVFPEE